MKNINFYQCSICGNIVEVVKNGGGTLVCCGKPMNKLEANTSDGAHEKHVPVVTKKDGKIYVEVGSVAHPMLPEHYIEWIAVVSENRVERVNLLPGEKPEAVFEDNGQFEVYEYCNLHGLWKAEIK